jgi:hypothetical protein
MRFSDGEKVYGSDTHLCDSNDYTETHLDGLNIYYNPFAEQPLNQAWFNAPEITHNHYDPEYKQPYAIHNDGVLVSRETFVERIG